eukprot:CAMPEP_0185802416 /NCGR_PEP_ID=MMETSP1322-20130828/1988_1 /TAXON_ID=265543 /ORGANISM="Minutocellus polymorphus, Strain RCC2270" /LENGTH=109 /DNA_ID=CAMNT_0028498175 /DNA_START=53 /DNA_END=382 /DNA_ORIENTATION=-
MMKTAAIVLSLQILPAALASNPFVSLGLNEDFVRLDRHAHDGRLRRIAAANANKLILPEESADVQMTQNRDNGGRPPIVNAIVHAVEDCDPDMLFEKELSRHQQGTKLV